MAIMASAKQNTKTLPFTSSTLFFGGGLVLTGAFWFSQVAVNVPEPYLVNLALGKNL